MQIKFIFPRTDILCYADADKCKIARSICEGMAELISLPDELSIEFISMPKNVYGDSTLDNKSKKYIRLNSELHVNDLMIPLVHELIHVSQMHEGILMITHDGIFIWDTVPYEVNLSDIHYKDYQMLPWEADVRHRQPKLLPELLKSYK